MTTYYICPKCGSKSLERVETGLEFPNYPEMIENCYLCGYSDAR